jgi:uncharacterized protein YndB with AHSA1/START domain
MARTLDPQERLKWRLTVTVAASPENVYALVSDVAGSPQWSKECTEVRWLGGINGPVVGARFRGHNRRRADRWSTVCEVVTADPGREFSFQTLMAGRPATKWTFSLAVSPGGDASELTEAVEQLREASLVRRACWRWLGGIRDREADLLDNVRRSLASIKELLEAQVSGAGR